MRNRPANSSQPPSAHVVFAGIGTPGRLLSALVIAERLADEAPETRITFADAGQPVERERIRAGGFGCVRLAVNGRSAVLGGLRAAIACRRARQFFQREGVGAVVWLGADDGCSAARAATKSRIPLVRFDQVMRRSLGIPLRPEITPASSARLESSMKSNGRKHILAVLGNDSPLLARRAPKALARIKESLADWTIVHQMHTDRLEITRGLYARLGLAAMVLPFVANMPRLLADAELVICSPSETLLAELAAASVPAVLLLGPGAGHQRARQREIAEVYTQTGGAMAIDEHKRRRTRQDLLADAVEQIVVDPARRRSMSSAIHRLARPDAAREIVSLIRALIRRPEA